MVLVKWLHVTSVELRLILLPGGGAWLISTIPAAKQKCSVCDANSNVYCVIHTTFLSDQDCLIALNTSRPDPHKKLSFLWKLVKGALQKR